MSKNGNKKKQSQGQVLTCPVQSVKDTKPVISFKYLHKCSKGDFKYLHKLAKHNNKKYFEELQKFLYEADSYTNITDLISAYTSKNSTSGLEKNYYIKELEKCFKKNYPKDVGLLENGIIHIHTRRGGNGKFVIFGITYEKTFYVLAFDPEHSFNKH